MEKESEGLSGHPGSGATPDVQEEHRQRPGEHPVSTVASHGEEVRGEGEVGGEGSGGSPAPHSRSHAGQLIDLAEAAGIIPFRTPDEEACVVVPVDQHVETWRVNGKAFRTWLRGQYYRRTTVSLREAAIGEAVATIESQALYDGQEHPVFVRIAEQDGKLFLDLADKEWRVVEVGAGGWRVVHPAPVRFLRPSGMRPLPVPQTGGALDQLRNLINVDDDSFKLVVAWLIGAFQFNRPFAILALHGEQGSGKTTQAIMLRGLIDPNHAGLRSFPREERDLVIAARNGWIVGFDNVSTLHPWLSDALCRLSTGTAFGCRQLYTDADEILFEAKRPVLLNGIEEVTIRGDLADRTLPIILPTIPEHRRRTEDALQKAYEAERPQLVGALLDVVVGVLTKLPTTQLDTPPRMADFARWVTAGEAALGWPPGSFVEVYAGNRKGTSTTVIDSSPVATSIRDLVATQQVIRGTAKDLLDRLDPTVAESVRKHRDWPKDPKTLSGILRRISPALRAVGIEVESSQTSGPGSKKLWTFRATGASPSDASDACDAPDSNSAAQQPGAALQPASHQASQQLVPGGREAEESVAGVARVAENPRVLAGAGSGAGDATRSSTSPATSAVSSNIATSLDEKKSELIFRQIMKIVDTYFAAKNPLSVEHAINLFCSQTGLPCELGRKFIDDWREFWVIKQRRDAAGNMIEVLEPAPHVPK